MYKTVMEVIDAVWLEMKAKSTEYQVFECSQFGQFAVS